MVVLTIISLVLIAPSLGFDDDCCLPLPGEGRIAAENTFDVLETEPLSEPPCDSECPIESACCAVCCKTALHFSSPSDTTQASASDPFASIPPLFPASDPGYSVWHPPRG